MNQARTMNVAALAYACCLSLALTAAAAAAAAGPAHTALLVAACCSVTAFAVTTCVELHRSRAVRRPTSAAAAVAGVAVAALALGICLGRPAAPAATTATRTAAPAAAPAAADIYRCALSPTALGDELEALVLSCPGAQVHLPGPYGDQINYPAGLLRVPGWQVDHMVYAGGQARVWAQDAHQSCLLRVDVAGVHRHPGTRITCNLRTPTPPTPQASPKPPRSA